MLGRKTSILAVDFGRGTGEVRARYGRGTGEVRARYGRGTGEGCFDPAYIATAKRTLFRYKQVHQHRQPPLRGLCARYVDPLLFAENMFQSQADYDQTVRLAVAKTKSGQIGARQPDLEE
jgi:hypothetical protein